MFFKFDFNKIELQVKLDISNVEVYAYFAFYFILFFENLSETRYC